MRPGRRPRPSGRVWLALASAGVLAAAGCSGGGSSATPPPTSSGGQPTAASPTSSPATAPKPAPRPNVYAAAGAGMLAPEARRARPLVYVPNSESNTVDVIDPRTYQVIRSFRTTATPQHIVPSWDLKTLWVNESSGNHLTAIDPRTGRPGRRVQVTDPYNLYFTPDGRHALVMAERLRRIDFRDPHTMALQHSLHVPCKGVNHADFTVDSRYFLASCEFSGSLIVAPADGSHVSRVINLTSLRGGSGSGMGSMPQDVRLTPDGRTFVVADMMRGGLWEVDARTFRVRGFLPTGKGAHGIYPSRDATELYVSNRGEGTISVVDATTLRVRTVWRLPGGGSPDMGGVTADGRQLWLSGRYNGVVYVIDTHTGRLLHRIRVGSGPHGLCVWPQPGRYSLGHTGNMR